MLAHAPYAFKNQACHFRNEGLAETGGISVLCGYGGRKNKYPICVADARTCPPRELWWSTGQSEFS